MRATNTFRDLEEVKPVAHPVKVTGAGIELNLPRHALVLLECEIA